MLPILGFEYTRTRGLHHLFTWYSASWDTWPPNLFHLTFISTDVFTALVRTAPRPLVPCSSPMVSLPRQTSPEVDDPIIELSSCAPDEGLIQFMGRRWRDNEHLIASLMFIPKSFDMDRWWLLLFRLGSQFQKRVDNSEQLEGIQSKTIQALRRHIKVFGAIRKFGRMP